jgi:hypothetical protein
MVIAENEGQEGTPGPKGQMILLGFMYGLKPVPFRGRKTYLRA